jgi:hypothetical protein
MATPSPHSVEGDYFSIVEEESVSVSWKFYLSSDLWDWVNWLRRSGEANVFRAKNGITIACMECVPGFGNGNYRTLFFNHSFRGRVSYIGPKTDKDSIGSSLELISEAFTELIEEASASKGEFSSPYRFPPDAKLAIQPCVYEAAFEMSSENKKKQWILKMEPSLYKWAAAKRKMFEASNGVKIAIDVSGTRTTGKPLYHLQKKMLLLEESCKAKRCKLPKKCYVDMVSIIEALIELSETYEMTHEDKKESKVAAHEMSKPEDDELDPQSFDIPDNY